MDGMRKTRFITLSPRRFACGRGGVKGDFGASTEHG